MVIEHLWYYALNHRKSIPQECATKLLFLIVENRLMFDMQTILIMTSHCITTSPQKLQDLAISFIEIVKPCICVRSTCYKYILYVDRFESVIYKIYNLNFTNFIQFDVIIRRICVSNILEYLKKEISQDSLAKYFTIVILNFSTIQS